MPSPLSADECIVDERIGLVGGSPGDWAIPMAATEGGVAFARTEKHVAKDPDFHAECAAMRCPARWVYGERDRSNPSELCIELIESVRDEHDRDFSVLRFPTANHSLFECRRGGAGELGALQRKVPGLYDGIDGWLEDQGLLP